MLLPPIKAQRSSVSLQGPSKPRVIHLQPHADNIDSGRYSPIHRHFLHCSEYPVDNHAKRSLDLKQLHDVCPLIRFLQFDTFFTTC